MIPGRLRRAGAALVVGALVTLAGCGGGGPSKESYVADADRVCRSGSESLASVRSPTSFPELAETAGKLGAAVDAQLPKLRALERPSGDDAAIDAVLGSLGGVSEAAKALQAAATRNDEKATATAAGDVANRAKSASDSGRAYGFTTCGGSVQPAANASLEGTKTVIKAGYVVKAQAFCQDASSQLDDLPEATSLRSAARVFERGASILEKLIGDLRALTPPPGDEGALNEFYVAQKQVADKAKEAGAAANAGDEHLVESLVEQFDVLTTAANAKADAYGIPDCGTRASF